MTVKKLALLLVALVGAIIVIAALQRQLLFPTHLVRAPDPSRSIPEAAERVWIESPEGDIEGWYMKGAGRSKGDPGPAVIFTHGNGEVIDHWPELLRWYRDRGIGALLAEYRGYGRSAGSPSTDKIRRDMFAFRELLADRPEVDADRLIYHGRSLGGGAACALASEHPPAALVLQSTFTSIADLAWHHYRAPSFLLRDEFDNLAYLREAAPPVLITHGEHDEIIPVEQARKLHESAPSSEYVEIAGCGHNDCPMKWDEIEQFLEERDLLP